MAKKDNRTLPMPLDLPQPYARPTGAVLDPEKPFTLPLTNEITLARLQGRYTEIDRKLWATLVALAFDDLGKKRIHQANMRDIARLFRELKAGRNGIDWLMASAKRQRQCGIDWEDEDEIGTVPLLGGLKIVKATGDIYYSFDDFLIEKLLDNKQFSRLRLHFLIGLSGKYSVDLYTLLEALANRQYPEEQLTVEELRAALNIEKGKLEPWKDFHKRAVAPAVEQINSNSAAAGFSVAYEPVTRGRRVVAVKFTVTKTGPRQLDDAKAKRRTVTASAKAAGTIPLFSGTDYEVIRAAIGRGVDIYAAEQDWRSVFAGKNPPDNPLGAFIAWLRKRQKAA